MKNVFEDYIKVIKNEYFFIQYQCFNNGIVLIFGMSFVYFVIFLLKKIKMVRDYIVDLFI